MVNDSENGNGEPITNFCIPESSHLLSYESIVKQFEFFILVKAVHLRCMVSLALRRIFSRVSIHKDLILVLVYPMVYTH